MFVHTDQNTQTAHRNHFLHAEELQLVPVLPALQREWIAGYIHQSVLPQSRLLPVLKGVSLAHRGITGQTGPHSHRRLLQAVITPDRLLLCGCSHALHFGPDDRIHLQSGLAGEENLTLWAEERALRRGICFPDLLNAGQAEVVSTLECHGLCEEILADGTFQTVLGCVHSSDRSGDPEGTVLPAFLLMKVSWVSLGEFTSLISLSVTLLKTSRTHFKPDKHTKKGHFTKRICKSPWVKGNSQLFLMI